MRLPAWSASLGAPSPAMIIFLANMTKLLFKPIHQLDQFVNIFNANMLTFIGANFQM